MGETMRLLPFGQLLQRIFEEYRTQRSVFDLHESIWFRKSDARTVTVMGERCDLPLGPAAGPHTQLSQNIVAAYLSGSRFIELKTVQILDRLEIEKPCIDAADEAYNSEWSTELSLDKAWREYARAWIVLHLIEEVWQMRTGDATRSFAFNMSVGYDMQGILQDPMQAFVARMMDPVSEPLFRSWLDELEAVVPSLLAASGLSLGADALQRVRRRAEAQICGSVTLSTMHGCPPEEIESICRYLLAEKKLNTCVKLNPTLLGYQTVRDILDGLGYDYVELDRNGFDHDLQYDTAIGILTRLRETARGAGRHFGVKLTNTLAVANNRGVLPGEQVYLSGRALYPLSISIAARLAHDFDGELPISYCGGISVHNAAGVFRSGIRPLTLCTTLLKPGGYARQAQIARALEAVAEWDAPRIDVAALERLAAGACGETTAHKQFRGSDEVRVQGDLPAYDCYQAPCVSACAIGQHVPEYIRLVGEQRYADALELIYERNALPAITGHICDHQCQYVCSRLDYEGCLNIRELKKIAVQRGSREYRKRWKAPPVSRGVRCAVIGAGPAGLAAAYFLAREGFAVTVFEREQSAGGVVRNVIPQFRLPVEAIESDIEFIAAHGVEFVFGAAADLSVTWLRERGFGPVFVAIGAEVGNEIELDGDRSRVMRSLDFLWDFRGNRSPLEVGRRVVVVGGGNTAMDAARAAMTLPQVETVDLLYRRSEHEMPADREEYENARADGVRFHFLRNPEAIDSRGSVTVRVMELGAPDESGRRRPLASDRTERVQADTVITAVGERVDSRALERLGIPLDDGGRASVDRQTLETGLADVYLGGDARTGPSTVVQCIASGRRAADAITRRHDSSWQRRERLPQFDAARRLEQIRMRKGSITAKPDAEDHGDYRAFAATEYERCLECSYICNRCVEVCPNRANITVATGGETVFNDPYQIVHLDAYCNECGNCGHFCPWSEGAPYRDKPTLFSTREDFDQSGNDGWLLDGNTLRARFGGQTHELTLSNGRLSDVPGVVAAEEGSAAGATADAAAAPDARGGDARAAAQFYRLFEIVYRDRPQLFGQLEVMR